MKWFLKTYLFLIPPIHLLITFLLVFVELDNSLWVAIGNSFGYSILTSIVYIYVFIYSGKYCDFTRFSVYGLFAISLFNTLGSILMIEDTSQETYRNYEANFSLITFTIVAIATAILLNKKQQEQ